MRAGRRPPGRCKARRSCGSRTVNTARSRCSRASRCRRCRVPYVDQPSGRRRVADLERLLPGRAVARARGLLLGAAARSRPRAARGRSARATASPSRCRSSCCCGRPRGGSSPASRRSSATCRRRAHRAALVRRGDDVLAMLLAPRIDWPRLDGSASCCGRWPRCSLPSALLEHAHPFANYGWVAWPAVDRRDARVPPRARGAVPVARRRAARTAFWLAAAARRVGTAGKSTASADGVWPWLPCCALGALSSRRCGAASVAWPLVAHEQTYVAACCGGVLAALDAADARGERALARRRRAAALRAAR